MRLSKWFWFGVIDGMTLGACFHLGVAYGVEGAAVPMWVYIAVLLPVAVARFAVASLYGEEVGR